MKKLTLEMPMISSCDVEQCGYNQNKNCHAKAITVGDGVNPNCDTYFENKNHNLEVARIAGVGACKVSSCKKNKNFECIADVIKIGTVKESAKCLTFTI